MHGEHNTLNTKYIALTLNPNTLVPTTETPPFAHYRVVWYLAMIYLGTQMATGHRLTFKLKQSALSYLKEVNQHCFGGDVYESTLEKQLNSAWDICKCGKNNLFGTIAANDNGDLELKIKVGG